MFFDLLIFAGHPALADEGSWGRQQQLDEGRSAKCHSLDLKGNI